MAICLGCSKEEEEEEGEYEYASYKHGARRASEEAHTDPIVLY
jgi:hypothetical protein